MVIRASVILIAAALLAGCSNLKPYADTPERNLNIRTQTESGSAFSRVRAAVDVYRVERDCISEYEGTTALDAPEVTMGIPAGRPSYLVFRFATSAFLGGSSSTISYDTLLTPHRGASYDVRVRYVENIYDVAIRDAAGYQVERRSLRACKPS